MYVQNSDEIIPILRHKLRDYLVLKGVCEADEKKFLCPVHNDNTPSMMLNPKTGFQTAHCFACTANLDIFSAAALLDNLPENGSDWMMVTVPTLAKLFGITVQWGESTVQDQEKAKLYKLAQDISDIIEAPNYVNKEYTQTRNWLNAFETCSTINEEDLINQLMNKGWSISDINDSLMIRTSKLSFFGLDKVTFTIRNHRGRPIAFISRNLSEGQKYLNTTETPIYEKRKVLLGLDKALNQAKYDGLYIVEGPGDRAQLLRLGIKNVVATCGTAFTADHLNLVRMLGIKNLYFCFDWDQAGTLATARVFNEALKTGAGISCWVVEAPEDMGANTDPDSYLLQATEASQFTNLPKLTAFEWVMKNNSDNDSPDIICTRMVPIIALEPTAVKRELLIKRLQDFTGISYQSISSDVNSIRSHKYEERKNRLVAAAQQYIVEVERDPENAMSLLSQHEQDIGSIEQDYNKDHIGVNYQLARYNAIQDMKSQEGDTVDRAVFIMNHCKEFANVLSGGMIYTIGTLFYFGGRANSGKTATIIKLGIDVALSDPDARVIMHFTDDAYPQVEPRIKTNIAQMIHPRGEALLSVGMAASPRFNIETEEDWQIYQDADVKFRDLLSTEKLIILDQEDGSTLTPVEKVLKDIRQRFPQDKILIICDNTHNYTDYSYLDRTSQITQISNTQKALATKYRACVMATAEYRKNMPMDQTKMRLPVNDDLADAKALMYRSNVIVHVYNDLNDRMDAAEFFWVDPKRPNEALPRLSLIFSKNKVSPFKKSLTMDLDPDSVTLNEISTDQKRLDYERYQANEGIQIIGGQIVKVATDYTEE